MSTPLEPEVVEPHTESEARAYKDEQRERLAKLQVNTTDQNGHVVSKIYSRGDEFVIYEISGVDDSESLRVLIDTETESDQKGLIPKFEFIKGDLAEFRSILHKGVHDKSIKHRAAHAISTALAGNGGLAKQIFLSIKEQVDREYQSITRGRLFYLSGAFSLVAFLSIISITAYILRDQIWVTHIRVLVIFIYSSAFSGCGGLLSISLNLSSIAFERELQRSSYFVYGMQRILFAALGGIFTYVAITGGLILGFVLKSDDPLFAIFTICIVSGFSETLIPNALRNIESNNRN